MSFLEFGEEEGGRPVKEGDETEQHVHTPVGQGSGVVLLHVLHYLQFRFRWPETNIECTSGTYVLLIQNSQASLAQNKKKHRKNCECGPVSNPRLKIWVKWHKSLGLLLKGVLIKIELGW